MAERFEKSGYAPHQTQIYREMVQFLGGCETAAEATLKLKESKYSLALGAALVQDKLAALAKAALENDMPEAAVVYQDKIAEIDADVTAMYETGYEQTAKNIKIQYIQTYEAFADVFDCYLTLSGSVAGDEVVIQGALRDLNEALSRLVKPSADFTELAVLPRFRKLIPANDVGYSNFVRAVPLLQAKGPDFVAEMQQLKADFERTLPLIAPEQETLKNAAQVNLKKIKRSQVLVTPPIARSGGYVYSDEEVTAYE